MTITDLIKRLEELRAEHGDVPVWVYDCGRGEPYPFDKAEYEPIPRDLCWRVVAPHPVVVIY